MVNVRKRGKGYQYYFEVAAINGKRKQQVNDRQPMDLIFLKDTYDTGTEGGISHVGIYMGTLTINGETAEWIIDTGGNPKGVKITKYQNGWWNSDTYFYGFGRLK